MTERHKRLLLGTIALLAGVYSYLALIISPTLAETARLRHDLEMSDQRGRAVTAELKELQAKERNARSKADLERCARDLLETIPTPYMVTTIPVMDKAFEEHEIPEAKVKLFMLVPFRAMPEYAIAQWNINVPDGHALRIGEVLAELENRFPLGRLAELDLKADPVADGSVSASIFFHTLVRP
jgi:hypothetical protein